MSRLRQADPTALAELSNAVAVKDQKYTVRDNPSFQAATVVPACKIENFEKLWKKETEVWKQSWTTTAKPLTRQNQ